MLLGVRPMRMFEGLPSPVRQFRHAPVYSAAVAGSLALAVAATCAAFAVVKKAFLDPLPYSQAERLLVVQTAVDDRTMSMSFFVSEDLRQSPIFSGTAPFRFSTVTYEAPDAAERVQAIEVTPAFYSVLGVTPALGTVAAADAPEGVVVSWAFFERALSADPASIGRRIGVDGVARPVIGVMPRGFVPPYSIETGLFVPLDTRALFADTARARRTVTVVARMADGVRFADVQPYLDVFSEEQRRRFPDVHARDRWVATPLREELISQSKAALIGTGAAAALLMVIVWANIAGLASAQAAATRRTMAVRRALGATSARLFRDQLAQSLMLAGIGTAAGLWLAYTLIRIAAGYQQQFLNTMPAVSFGPATAALGIVLGAITGVLAAFVPQRAMSTINAEDLIGSGRSMAGGARLTRLRSGLVVVQVAVALVLIVSAGLLVRTVGNISATRMGFETEHLATISLMLPTSRYRTTPAQVQFEQDVVERLRAVRGVRGVSASVGFPAGGAMGARLTILDRPAAQALPEIVYFSVAPKFFTFLGVPITAGRDIEDTDDFPAPRVVVINETMARMFWPEGGAIGARVKIGAGAPTDREIVVVGIVPDVRQHGPTNDIRPTAYGSTLQYSWPRRHFSVRASLPVGEIAADLRSAIQAVDPLVAIPAIRPLNDQLSQQTARHRLVMFVLGVFGVVATVLCGFGLYAVVALTSQLRHREYAIRVALGARRDQVWWLVARQSLVLAAAGAAVGVALASGATGVLQGTLHGVDPTDEATFSMAVVAVILLALTASVLPAWKAGRIDPVTALKAE